MSEASSKRRMHELAMIVYGAIQANPDSFKLPSGSVENITIKGIEQELENFVGHKEISVFMASIFDQVFRTLIQMGYVQTKEGETFRIKDYERNRKASV